MKVGGRVIPAGHRQFRWPILLWLAIVAAETVLTAIRPAFLSDMRAYGNAGMMLNLLWDARQLAMLLMVPLVVQAHPAVGTDAFWMTRPFPPGTVFASKAILLATLTVLVPAAATLALMLWIQVPLREALLVALDEAIGHAAWLAVLVAGAAVTLNLPRFALLSGGVLLSLVLLMTVLFMRVRNEDAYGTATLVSAGSGQPVLPPSEDPTGSLLFQLSVIAAGFGLAAVQYRTHLRRVSVPAGAGGLLLLALAIPHWPFPLLAVPSALPASAHDPNAVQLHAAAPVIEMTPARDWFGEGGPTSRSGRTAVVVSRLESGWVPRLTLRGVSLTLENGTTVVSRGRGMESVPQIEGSPDDPSRIVAREVLGVEHVLMPAPPAQEMATTLLLLPSAGIDPVMPATVNYRGEFFVHLTRWEVAAALPLRAGAAFRDEGFNFAMEQVNTGPDEQMSVRAREWRATSSFDRKPQVTYAFYVRNARHSHAMAGNESEPFGGMGAMSFGIPFVVSGPGGLARSFVRAARVSFPASYGLQDQKIDWDPGWYADAELVIVRMTEAGAVLRTLDMPRTSLVAKR
jgi:hypothetical protein